MAIERRRAREHVDARLRVAHARVGRGEEGAQLGVFDLAVAVDVGGAAQRRAQLVRQDAAAIARPLVRLLIARGGDDDAGARMALELLLLEERLQVRVAGGALVGRDRVVDPRLLAAARVDQEVALAGVDDDVDEARLRRRDHVAIELGARQLGVAQVDVALAVAVDVAVAGVDEEELGLVAAIEIARPSRR